MVFRLPLKLCYYNYMMVLRLTGEESRGETTIQISRDLYLLWKKRLIAGEHERGMNGVVDFGNLKFVNCHQLFDDFYTILISRGNQ